MLQSTILQRLKGFADVQMDAQNVSKVYFNNGKLLKHYNSIIVVELNGKIYLGKNYAYSKTTAKHRNAFLGLTTKEIEEKIENKEFKILG